MIQETERKIVERSFVACPSCRTLVSIYSVKCRICRHPIELTREGA